MATTLRYLGVGIEDEFGVAVPAEQHVDIASTSLDSPSEPVINYDGGMGRNRRIVRPGAYVSEGGAEFPVDVETIGYFLYLTLGKYVNEQDVDTNEEVHTFNPSDDVHLPSATFRAGKDKFEHVFPGCVISQMEISVSDGLAMVNITVVGGKDAKDPLKDKNELILSETFPIAFHEVNVMLNNDPEKTSQVESLTITVNNNADAEAGIALGSRFPKRIFAGNIDIDVSMDVAFDSMDEKEVFWGGQDGPSEGEITSIPMEVTMTSGDTGSLTILMPRVVYNSVQIQPSGRDRIVQSVDASAYFDDTSETEMSVELRNNVTYNF